MINLTNNHVNIKDIEDALKNEDASPPDLALFSTVLSGYYSYYGQMLKRIQLRKPQAWLNIQENEQLSIVEATKLDQPIKKRDKSLSDKKTERMWEATEDGQAEIALEWELKRIEKMMQAINKRLYVDNVAAKNNY
jgi:hypothetical protein